MLTATSIPFGRHNSEMSFEAFDQKKLDEYAAQAKASWGDTRAYREFAERAKGRTQEEDAKLGDQMMAIFRALGEIREQSPASGEAQALVKCLQEFITGHYYACTREILAQLGQMYAAGGDFTDNIDEAGGAGTAAFAAAAIGAFCKE